MLCVNVLKNIQQIINYFNLKKLQKFCLLKTLPKKFKDEIKMMYYDADKSLNETDALHKFKSIINKFELIINDLETIKCDLCNQLNTSSEISI